MSTATSWNIAIVGAGAVLPGVPSAAAFCRSFCSIGPQFRPLPAKRMDARCHLGDRGSRLPQFDKSASNVAAWIDDPTVARLRRELNLEDEVAHPNLHLLALAAATEALSGLRLPPPERRGQWLGCMDYDESYARRIFWRLEGGRLTSRLGESPELLRAAAAHYQHPGSSEKGLLAASFNHRVCALIRERMSFAGEACLLDAACASSLAALHAAMVALRSGSCDLALSGGIEANIGPETQVLFSRLGALAESACVPFSPEPTGLLQGEGAVIFALKRAEDASRDGDRVLGIIHGIGAGSDGRSSSLFEPTADGQMRAYASAHQPWTRAGMGYVEAHGTGTRKGDATEIDSITRFFADVPLRYASGKAWFGHTKAAAGAAGLLRTLELLNRGRPEARRVRPASSDSPGGRPVLSPGTVELHGDGDLAGVSSFGFGGINFHLVVGRTTVEGVGPVVSPRLPVVLCAVREIGPVDDLMPVATQLRIPLRTLRAIDRWQVTALVAASGLVEGCRRSLNMVPPSRVHVVTASPTGLERCMDFAIRVHYNELEPLLGDARRLEELRSHLPPTSEDDGPGILNNVAAGRIANQFDFHGFSLNVDAELGSRTAAFDLAERWLGFASGVLILVASESRFNRETARFSNRGAAAYLLADERTAHECELPIIGRVTARNAPATA